MIPACGQQTGATSQAVPKEPSMAGQRPAWLRARVCMRQMEARPRQMHPRAAISGDPTTDACLGPEMPGYSWDTGEALPAGKVYGWNRGLLQSQKTPVRGFSAGLRATSPQRPRAWRTGSSTEAAECMETPGAPMLVSQQSNPQLVRACLAASTLARSRPEEGRLSALTDGTRQTLPPCCVSCSLRGSL